MALFRAYVPIDMTFGGAGSGPSLHVDSADAATIVLADGTGYTETYRGAFTYDVNDQPYGRLDSLVADYSGYRLVSMSQLGADMHTFTQLTTYGTPEESYAYLLRGNDRMVTTSAADYLRGFAGNDSIDGRGGNDVIHGDTGLDRLYGGNGSDYLDGGGGGDLMDGGMGNDRFVSDNPNDRIVEAADQGIDTIFSSVSRGMAANVENLTLLAAQPLWAVGNGLANTMRGNAADNAISGGAGDDSIYGGEGNDRLNGGAGIDHLVGDGGRDMFVFVEATGLDFIHAFQHGLDRVNLAAIDAVAGTAGDQAFSYVGSAGLSGAAGELSYDGTTLSGDVDGDGRGDFAIRLANHPALSEGDLVL